MSQSSVVPATTAEREAAQKGLAEEQQPKQLDALHTEHGDTTIADAVVAKFAGIAAREVPGVYAMGNAARRAIGNLTQRVSRGAATEDVTGGVTVEKGESQTAVAVAVVVEYGVAIVDVADQIRDNVIRAVEHGTGLEVVSVDVNVSDVRLPEDDEAEPADSAELR